MHTPLVPVGGCCGTAELLPVSFSHGPVSPWDARKHTPEALGGHAAILRVGEGLETNVDVAGPGRRLNGAPPPARAAKA